MLTACSCVVNINKRTLDSYVSVPDFRLRNARTPHHQEFGYVMRSTELDIIDKTTTTTHSQTHSLIHSTTSLSLTLARLSVCASVSQRSASAFGWARASICETCTRRIRRDAAHNLLSTSVAALTSNQLERESATERQPTHMKWFAVAAKAKCAGVSNIYFFIL